MKAPGAARKPRARPKAGRPRKLSQEVIVDAAEALIYQAGLARLTMRSLGARLGVQAPTLYTYFKNLDEIRALAMERITAVIPFPDLSRPALPVDQIIELFVAMRSMHLRNPELLSAPQGSVMWKWSIRSSNQLLKVYYALGADLEHALLVHRILSGLTVSNALSADIDGSPEAIAGRRRLVAEMPEEEVGLMRDMYRRMPLLAQPTEPGLRELLRASIAMLLPSALKPAR